MKPNQNFLNKDINFWANVRAFSEKIGYTKRGKESVLKFTENDIRKSIPSVDLKRENYFKSDNSPTTLTLDIIRYSNYRADVLNNFVSKKLLNRDTAKALFYKLRTQYQPSCPIPMNKQKGIKKAEAFFTGIINMLIEANIKGHEVDYDPKKRLFTRICE